MPSDGPSYLLVKSHQPAKRDKLGRVNYGRRGAPAPKVEVIESAKRHQALNAGVEVKPYVEPLVVQEPRSPSVTGNWEPNPFEKGNRASIVHGAQSVATREAAEEIRLALRERFEFLGDPIFTRALQTLCDAQSKLNALSIYVDNKIALDGVESVPDSRFQTLDRLYNTVMRAQGRCGLDPEGFAKIAKDMGWASSLAKSSVATLGDRGREVRERRRLL